MWHSATASAVALLQEPHLLVGGLGGVIAVIVGGVVSIIVARASKRTLAQPAANPQPAPASRRPPAPPDYGVPAPPTSPSRRLHPGPISLGAPARPQRDDAEPVSTSLFNPDILTSPQAEPGETLAELGAPVTSSAPALPFLRPASSIVAEWRAHATPSLTPGLTSELTRAPIWNRSPFARSGERDAEPIAPEITVTSEPPVWRSLGALMADAEPTFLDLEASTSLAAVESFAAYAPIWQSRLHALGTAAPGGADEAPPSEMASDEASDVRSQSALPIWPSSLRRD